MEKLQPEEIDKLRTMSASSVTPVRRKFTPLVAVDVCNRTSTRADTHSVYLDVRKLRSQSCPTRRRQTSAPGKENNSLFVNCPKLRTIEVFLKSIYTLYMPVYMCIHLAHTHIYIPYIYIPVYIIIYLYIGGLQIIGVLESTSGCLTFISRTPLSIITSEDG